MAKVKILMSIAGHAEPLYGLEDFSFQPGQEVDVDDALAALWITGGHAEAVDVGTPVETASLDSPRKAVLPSGARKKIG